MQVIAESKVLESIGAYDVEISTSIRSVEKLWNVVAPKDILFSPAFLSIIENCPPSGIKPLYGIASLHGKPVGILYFQFKYVELRDQLRFESKGFSLATLLKKSFSYFINFNCTICGNTLLTGQYGNYFLPSVSPEKREDIIEQGFKAVNIYLKGQQINPAVSVTKDYFSNELPFAAKSPTNFIKFSVQPKMILKIRSQWLHYTDYLSSLKSKYRIRNNKVRSSMESIVVEEFDCEKIELHKEIIHELYKQISDNAGFNAFVLHKDYFYELKKQLGENIQFKTYWKGDKMIAFYTAIHNESTLDAHFLGYDKDENLHLHLYNNILLDLLVLAIDTKKQLLDLSRTAVEIKSTIGAEPHDMFLYIRHEKRYFNKISKKILDFVKPNDVYTIRNPFKD